MQASWSIYARCSLPSDLKALWEDVALPQPSVLLRCICCHIYLRLGLVMYITPISAAPQSDDMNVRIDCQQHEPLGCVSNLAVTTHAPIQWFIYSLKVALWLARLQLHTKCGCGEYSFATMLVLGEQTNLIFIRENLYRIVATRWARSAAVEMLSRPAILLLSFV